MGVIENWFVFFSKTIQSGKLKLVQKHPILQSITIFQILVHKNSFFKKYVPWVFKSRYLGAR